MFVQESSADCKTIDLMPIKHVGWFYLERSSESLRRYRNIYTEYTLESKLSKKKTVYNITNIFGRIQLPSTNVSSSVEWIECENVDGIKIRKYNKILIMGELCSIFFPIRYVFDDISPWTVH